MRKSLSRIALALAIAAVSALTLTHWAPTAEAAATGSTDIDITLPDIVILHYYSDVDISISAAVLGNLFAGTPGDSTVNEGVVSGTHVSGLTYDLAMGPSALGGDPSAVTLVLQDAWAVRSISLLGFTDTELDIDVTTTTLAHSTVATSDIEITGWAVDDGGGSGDPITFAAPGLASPVVGDVELTLDLTDAANAGDYEDGVYELTATNI